MPIEFGPTPDGCPAPTGAAIVGGGGDEAGQLMYTWGVTLCQPPHLTSVNYIPANSIDGRTNFINGLSDFAVTGTPFSASQRAQLQRKHRTFAYAPIAASGLVLAYKIFDQDPAQAEPGSQITNLKLTPSLVAQIFTGSIPNWEVNAQIRALNPHHIFPPTIFPLVRGGPLQHQTAFLFTSWLTATAGKGLPKGWPAPSSNYPLKYLTPSAAIVGGNNLAYAIADPASVNNSNDYFAVGYIGFIDSSQAHFYGLPTARLENAAGKFVRATQAAITAALAHATRNPDGVTVRANFKTRDKKAYPMPIVDYATAPTGNYNGAKGATLRAFLQYAVTTGQKTLAPGYTPLPASMISQTTKVIPEIPATVPASTIPPGDTSTAPEGSDTGVPPSGGGSPPPSHGTTPGSVAVDLEGQVAPLDRADAGRHGRAARGARAERPEHPGSHRRTGAAGNGRRTPPGEGGTGRIRARPAPTTVAATMSTGTHGGVAVSEARDPDRALRQISVGVGLLERRLASSAARPSRQ